MGNEIQERWARNKGYGSVNHYAQVLCVRKNSSETFWLQRRFEDNMRNIGLVRKPIAEDRRYEIELREEVQAALVTMKGIHYAMSHGAEGYGPENPDGQRYAEVLQKLYFEGKQVSEVAKDMDLTPQRVRIIRRNGLDNLGRILARRIR